MKKKYFIGILFLMFLHSFSQLKAVAYNPIQPTVPAFKANNLTICVGGTVQFTDTSSRGGMPNHWEWTFAGGTPESSTSKNPLVQYNTAGTYSVSLTTSNARKSPKTISKNGYIIVSKCR
jgi:PKD repeat protein